jgi:DNA-binding MarR family transcriptional regulator
VDVRRDGPDRRSVQLHVRSEGRRLLRRMPGPFAGVLPDALAGLDADTLQRMEADLSLLIQRLQADGRAGSIRLTVR